MQPRRFSTLLWQCLVMFVPSISIALLGCSDSTDSATPQDLENRTFIFDSSFIDTGLEGLTATLRFKTVSADNSIPFDLTLSDEAAGADEAIALMSGPATINSVELRIEEITDENDNMVDSIVIFDVTFTVGEIIAFDVNVEEEDDGTLEFTFIKDSGSQILFEFGVGEVSAEATPVRQ